jgi:hypothetical protein
MPPVSRIDPCLFLPHFNDRIVLIASLVTEGVPHPVRTVIGYDPGEHETVYVCFHAGEQVVDVSAPLVLRDEGDGDMGLGQGCARSALLQHAQVHLLLGEELGLVEGHVMQSFVRV